MANYSEINIAVICREINPADGAIDVHLCEITTLQKIMIFPLQIRQRYNPGLKFYFIKEEYYNNESTREYIFDLIRKEKSSSLIVEVEGL